MTPYQFAKKYIDLHESKNKKELMELFKSTLHIDFDPSTTPWCAAFVNAMEKLAGNEGTGKYNARSFLNYGIEVDDPQEGDIIIFTRGGNAWQGHVAFFVEWVKRYNDEWYIKTLGGNQKDSVSYAVYAENTVLGIRRK